MRLLLSVGAIFFAVFADTPAATAQTLCDGSSDTMQLVEHTVRLTRPPYEKHIARWESLPGGDQRQPLTIWIAGDTADSAMRKEVEALNRPAGRRQDQYVLVGSDRMADLVRWEEGSDAYPDVIDITRSRPVPKGWAQRDNDLVLRPAETLLFPSVTKWPAQNMQVGETLDGLTRSASYLRRAPHLQTVVSQWAQEGNFVWPVPQRYDNSNPNPHEGYEFDSAKVAVRVMSRLLHGQSIAKDADPALFQMDAEVVRDQVLDAEENEDTSKAVSASCAYNARAGRSLSAIAVRSAVAGASHFNILQSLVILRSNVEDGQTRWRVLLVSLNLQEGEIEKAMEELSPFMGPNYIDDKVDDLAHTMKNPSAAAPADGDSRPLDPIPELWIDPAGDASRKLLIEWVPWPEDGYASYPYFVNDYDPKLLTRTPAPFAILEGEVRWRVWALGYGEAITISPWRTVTLHQ